MVSRTMVITGPGGIGKSPLDDLFKNTVLRIDPYRLRPNGPRNSSDNLYAPPSLHNYLKNVLEKLGDLAHPVPCQDEDIEWYPKSKVLFFTVRGVWQCLFLDNTELTQAELAKAEIYAPVLVILLKDCDGFREALGEIQIVVLNPATQSLTKMTDWNELKAQARKNCEKRGDEAQSINGRIDSINAEAPAWKILIEEYHATEYVGWPFAEYCYPKEDEYGIARASLLVQARQRLLRGNQSLGVFLKSEQEILGI